MSTPHSEEHTGAIDATGKDDLPTVDVWRRVTDHGDALTFKTRAHIFESVLEAIHEGRHLWGHVVTSTSTLFDALDTNGDHSLTPREFKDGMIRLGLGLSVVQAEELIALFDNDGDGDISKKEWDMFVKEMKKRLPESHMKAEDMAFNERNMLSSVSEMRKFNEVLRNKTLKDARSWNKSHKNSPVAAVHGKTGLLPYTQFPVGDAVFENFGRPYVYSHGWTYRTRVTALDIPDAKNANALQVADQKQDDPSHPATRYNLMFNGGRRNRPRVSFQCPRGSGVPKDPLERMLDTPSLTMADRFRVWSYRHKSTVLSALSGYDKTDKGLMSVKRMVWVYTEVLKAAGSEAVSDMLAAFPKCNVGRYKNVVDYSAFAASVANDGVKRFNQARQESVLRQTVPMPGCLPVMKNASTKKIQRAMKSTMSDRKVALIDLEHRAARQLLKSQHFEETSSPERRDIISKTMMAYSGTKGVGVQRAIASATRRAPLPSLLQLPVAKTDKSHRQRK
eukprot:m.9094 g.9094  ORF g.9094 m.9094 type:complete len:506 (+) comp2596_c0_seq1:299-1816(+)